MFLVDAIQIFSESLKHIRTLRLQLITMYDNNAHATWIIGLFILNLH